MGIINRDFDPTGQVDNFDSQSSVVGVSLLIQVGQIPYVGRLIAIATSAFSLSGSPTVGVQIQRFIAGSGITTIPLNGSSLLTITAFSTSGIQLHSLPNVGSSLVQLLNGDNIQLVTSTANTAATYVVNAVIQCLQDFKTEYGVNLSN